MFELFSSPLHIPLCAELYSNLILLLIILQAFPPQTVLKYTHLDGGDAKFGNLCRRLLAPLQLYLVKQTLWRFSIKCSFIITQITSSHLLTIILKRVSSCCKSAFTTRSQDFRKTGIKKGVQKVQDSISAECYWVNDCSIAHYHCYNTAEKTASFTMKQHP